MFLKVPCWVCSNFTTYGSCDSRLHPQIEMIGYAFVTLVLEIPPF